MEYLHVSSTPASKSELSLFAVPPTQVAIDSTYEVEYRTSATLESSTVHEIVIPPSEDFTDLAASMVHVQLTLHSGDGSAIPPAKVRSVADFANALFEQIDLNLGTVNTSQATNLYHYQAFLEDLLFRHPVKCDIGRYDEQKDLSGNIDLYFRLHLPMCEQDRLLVNGVPLLFKFTRSKETFPIITAEPDIKIKISKLALHLKRVRLFPDAQMAILNAMESSPAKYFIIRNEVKSFSLNKGILGETLENVFNGILPRRIVIGLVDEKGFSGDKGQDPFKFEHFNINHLSLNVDGVMVPSISYQPDYVSNMYMREYVNLYRFLGQDEGVPQMEISHADYKSKYNLYAFDLSGPLGAESGTLSLLKRGAIRLELKFSSATSKQIKIIVFGQFDNLITIDKERNVILDY